jgi:hypothetical protein
MMVVVATKTCQNVVQCIRNFELLRVHSARSIFKQQHLSVINHQDQCTEELVNNAFHYIDITGDMAFISSEIHM